MRELNDKRILVAGCATGIGAATARRLAEEGCSILLGDIDGDRAAAVAAELNVPWRQFDLENTDSITELVSAAEELLGGLDGVANIAADTSPATLSRDGDLATMNLDVWRHTINTNLIGYAWIIKQAIPLLLKAGGGAIVNVSSDSTSVGFPVPAAYAASKAGVNTLARHVATRWGKDNIRCNSISPGAVLTEPMLALGTEYIEERRNGTPHARLGQPEDIAAAIAFLLSRDGEWVTGQVWSVNGGTVLRE